VSSLRKLLATAVLGAAIGLAPTRAFAEAPPSPSDLPRRQATFSWDRGRTTLRVNVSYRDVVDATVQKQLSSGLPTTIVMRGWVFRETGGEAVALTVKTCRVLYDLWDEVFQLTISTPGSPDKPDVALNLEGVLRKCAEARELPLLAPGDYPKEPLFFAAIVEVNPVSPEMMAQVKRWMSRPTGTSSTSLGGALFGSFVGLFVTRIDEAQARLAFRTQAFSL